MLELREPSYGYKVTINAPPSPDTHDWRGVPWHEAPERVYDWYNPFAKPHLWIIETKKGEEAMKATHQHILDTIKKALESAEDKEKNANEKLFAAELEHGEENVKQFYHSLGPADQVRLLKFIDAWIKSEPAKS